MLYDAQRNAAIDPKTGEIIIQFKEGDQIPPEFQAIRSQYINLNNISSSRVDSKELDTLDIYEDVRMPNNSQISPNNKNGSFGYPTFNNKNFSPSQYEIQIIEQSTQPESYSDAARNDDWTLARALQLMEFEIIEETRRDNGDFDEKEYRASSCKRQLLTLSTFVCIIQIIILIVMIEDTGLVSSTENPLVGPSASTMVKYGAKSAWLVVHNHEWWRLITSIFLHAGIIHIISNVFVQLRVGGYLNLVFKSPRWAAIYLLSGIFGNMFSCIFIPNSVGVGSSGAVIGMLSAWMVWIIFRWKKIPRHCHSQRNCQLVLLTVAMAFTLGFSFSPFVDWAAHFGGFTMGILTGCCFLSTELDNRITKISVFIISLMGTVVAFIWAIYYILVLLKPTDIFA